MDQLQWFIDVERTGDLKMDVEALFEANLLGEIYKHTKRAVKKGRKLSIRHELDEHCLDSALYLHDIGRIVPKEQVVEFLNASGVVMLDNEKDHPDLLHQKVSVVIAQEFFGMTDPLFLDAIKCHTTMKPNPNTIEKLVFLSDKLSRQDKLEQALIKKMKKAAKKSVDQAILIYLENQYIHRDDLQYYHEDSRHAYMDFKYRVHKIYRVKKIKPTSKKEAL